MAQDSSYYPGVILLQSKANVRLGGLRNVQNISPVTALMQPLFPTLNSLCSIPVRAFPSLFFPHCISHCSFPPGCRCCGLVLPCRTLGQLTGQLWPPVGLPGLVVSSTPHGAQGNPAQWLLDHRAHQCLVPVQNISCPPHFSSITLMYILCPKAYFKVSFSPASLCSSSV